MTEALILVIHCYVEEIREFPQIECQLLIFSIFGGFSFPQEKVHSFYENLVGLLDSIIYKHY